MRNILLLTTIAGVLMGCQSLTPLTPAQYVAKMNADPRVWPPVVEGQPFPVQTMSDKN
jgi:hypothetical protein